MAEARPAHTPPTSGAVCSEPVPVGQSLKLTFCSVNCQTCSGGQAAGGGRRGVMLIAINLMQQRARQPPPPAARTSSRPAFTGPRRT